MTFKKLATKKIGDFVLIKKRMPNIDESHIVEVEIINEKLQIHAMYDQDDLNDMELLNEFFEEDNIPETIRSEIIELFKQ